MKTHYQTRPFWEALRVTLKPTKTFTITTLYADSSRVALTGCGGARSLADCWDSSNTKESQGQRQTSELNNTWENKEVE